MENRQKLPEYIAGIATAKNQSNQRRDIVDENLDYLN